MIGPRAFLRRTSARFAFGAVVRDLRENRPTNYRYIDQRIALGKRLGARAGLPAGVVNDRLRAAYYGPES